MRRAHRDAHRWRQIGRAEVQIVRRVGAEAHGVSCGFKGIRFAAHMAPQPHREEKRGEFERPIVEKSVHNQERHLSLRPTTKVAVWGPTANCRPSPTTRIDKASRFPRVREGGRLAIGPQTATLVVGRKDSLSLYVLGLIAARKVPRVSRGREAAA